MNWEQRGYESEEEATAQVKREQQDRCKHLRFFVAGCNRRGDGTCRDCGVSLCLDLAFTNLAEEMFKRLQFLDEKIAYVRGG
jgi:hypothetical protein